MLLSIRRSRPSRRGYLRKIGSRYDGGTATPSPVQERMRKDGENNFLTSLKAGYRIFTAQSPTFTVATPVDLRNALRNFPWRRNQSVSERQKRVERQMMTGAPMITMDARSRAVRFRFATLFSPERFHNAPSNKAPVGCFDRCSAATRSSWIGDYDPFGPFLPAHHRRPPRRLTLPERSRLPWFCN
jgi:hypothetical protein